MVEGRKAEYPIMARVAMKYFAISGTSTPAERIISRLGLLLCKRRLSLKGELFSKMMGGGAVDDCITTVDGKLPTRGSKRKNLHHH